MPTLTVNLADEDDVRCAYRVLAEQMARAPAVVTGTDFLSRAGFGPATESSVGQVQSSAFVSNSLTLDPAPLEPESIPPASAVFASGVPAGPPPPPPPAPVAGAELDSAGVVWDEKLHSSSKAKLADGTWRKRRNGPADAPPPPPLPQPPLPLTLPNGLPAPPPVEATAFQRFMPLITARLASNDVTLTDVTAACHAAGSTLGLVGLSDKPESIPIVAAALGIAWPPQ